MGEIEEVQVFVKKLLNMGPKFSQQTMGKQGHIAKRTIFAPLR
jgi:hypothetical protein